MNHTTKTLGAVGVLNLHALRSPLPHGTQQRARGLEADLRARRQAANAGHRVDWDL